VGLPAELWVIQIGIFLNMLGWGAVLSFEVIYLHEWRGFSLGTAGLVVGTVTAVAVAAAPAAGPIIDRFGARLVASGAAVALALGYGGLAFVQEPWQGFLAAAAAGVGNGAFYPSQSALFASLATRELRPRITAVSRVAANVGFGLGGGLGGLIAAHGLNGFVLLFLGNGLTYLAYVTILVAVVREVARPEPLRGGYRLVVRDRAFLWLASINVALIGVGWGVFSWVVPPFAQTEVGASSQLIGLLLVANAGTVVLAQLPIVRLAEGRRRASAIAAAALAFVVACLLVAGGAILDFRLAAVSLVAAAVIVGIGECFYTAVLMPLVADLAPVALLGRYMAAIQLSWWLGLALAPTVGTQLLALWPPLALLAGAVLAAAAGLAAGVLERELPEASRMTPRPRTPTPA
jgi:MFS family permease